MRTIAGQAQMKPKPTILKVRIEKGRCVCVLRLDKRAGSSVVAERLAQLLHTKPAVIRSLPTARSEEHTSELQSLMRISYDVFCLKKKKIYKTNKYTHTTLKT